MGAKQPGPGQATSNLFLLVGVLGILGGLALLVYGLAPAKDLWDAIGPTFSGAPPPEDLADRMDASMSALKARAVVDALGFLALLAGVVLAQQGFAKPKSKPVEQLVEEEVARRLAAVPPPVHGATVSWPSMAPPTSSGTTGAGQPGPVAPVPRRTHCATCGGVLVAGGRVCPQGHAQG